MAISIEKVEKLIAELRKQPDLLKFRDEQGVEFAKNNGIQVAQLQFLLAVVANERMKKGNEKAKQDIINKKKIMPIVKDIETYRIGMEFVSPLHTAPKNIVVKHEVGDLIFVIEDEVWVRYSNKEYPNQHAKAIYGAEFVRINPMIFIKLL